jgi:hypothetical protein
MDILESLRHTSSREHTPHTQARHNTHLAKPGRVDAISNICACMHTGRQGAEREMWAGEGGGSGRERSEWIEVGR